MARENTTRGHSPVQRPERRRAIGITGLRPTWRGVAFAVVAIALVTVEVVTGDSALLLVLVVLVLPLLLAPLIVLERAHRADGAEIHVMIAPPLVPVGARCDLLLQVTHSGGAGLPPLSLDRPADHWSARPPGARPSSGPAPQRVSLAPGVGRLIRWDRSKTEAGASAIVSLPTRRRGVFTIGPLRLWVHDPFALFGLTVARAKPVTLVVHPRAVIGMTTPSVRPGSSGSMEFSDGPAGVHTDDPGGEWSGLRPYEPGDRLHLLSWQAEARFGALLVHDFRPDSEDVVTIVFDDRAGVHRRAAFEKALGVVYGLASAVEASATEYDVTALSGRRVQGTTTADGLVALLTFLAETQPTRAAHNAGPGAAAPPHDGALVITTPTALPTLPPSLDQGSVVVVE